VSQLQHNHIERLKEHTWRTYGNRATSAGLNIFWNRCIFIASTHAYAVFKLPSGILNVGCLCLHSTARHARHVTGGDYACNAAPVAGHSSEQAAAFKSASHEDTSWSNIPAPLILNLETILRCAMSLTPRPLHHRHPLDKCLSRPRSWSRLFKTENFLSLSLFSRTNDLITVKFTLEHATKAKRGSKV
jgi:hypothetical protein